MENTNGYIFVLVENNSIITIRVGILLKARHVWKLNSLKLVKLYRCTEPSSLHKSSSISTTSSWSLKLRGLLIFLSSSVLNNLSSSAEGAAIAVISIPKDKDTLLSGLYLIFLLVFGTLRDDLLILNCSEQKYFSSDTFLSRSFVANCLRATFFM